MPREKLVSLEVEQLEERDCPSISIQLDYSHDTSGFFTSHPDRESVLATAANALASRLGDSLSAIIPNPATGDTWNAVFDDPSTGAQTQIGNLTVAANTIIIFAGGQPLAGGEDGFGSPGGLNASGDQAWLNVLQGRGKPGTLGPAASQTAFAPWGGSVAFDNSSTAWYFGADPAGIQPNQEDFLSVAEHEIGHVLGFGTSNSWTNRVSGSAFIGPNAVAEFGGPVPTDAAGSAAQHWADGTTDRGMHCTMDPSFHTGARATFTPLDFAGLEDLGWTLLPPPPPPRTGWHDVLTGDFLGNGKQDIAGMTASGQWWVAVSNGSGFTSQLWTTWSSALTWVDVQVGDFNGDGKADIVGRALQNGQWWVAQSTGSSFSNALWTTWSPNATWVDVKVGDFSGDGKSDITGRWLQAGQWWTATSTGSSFTNRLWTTWSTAATWVDTQVGDFNGDGKADITSRWKQGGSWWTGISTGTSFTTTLWAQWIAAVTWVDVRVGDFNGAVNPVTGKRIMDITARWLQGGSWWTGISTGTSFNTSSWAQWNAAVTWVDVQVGDFNGDGKDDITARWLQGGSWWTGISSGSSFNTSQWGVWSSAVNWVDVQSAEIDGDKFTDLVGRWSDTGQWWAGISNGSGFSNQLWTTWAA
jgi:hypothetical protein